MKKMLLFCALFVGLASLSAQQNPTEKCAFDRLHQELMKQPAVQKAMEKNRRHLENYKNSAESRSSAIAVIPVVVHVFHCGEAIGAGGSGGGLGANIPDAQITSAIANLNDAFAHSGIYADGMHNGYTANTDARFTLAGTAPDGSATNGINRIDLSGQPWGSTYCSEGMDAGQGGGVAEATVKAVSSWPASDYMNVWLVHKIENGGTCAGTLGFASFPGTTAGTTDGLTVLSGAFGYDPTAALWPNTLCPTVNLNGTADHEVGHYLNLHHTFNGDNGGANCPPSGAGAGDECGDIPPHIRSSGCPADMTTGNTCDSNGPNPYIHNFMDYVDDNCYHGFSGDQKLRIDASIAVGGPREALRHSLGGGAPTGAYPTAATCTPTTGTISTDGPVSITLNGTTWISSNASLDGGSINRVASQAKVDLQGGTAYTMTVGMAGSDYCNVYIDYNDDGDFGDTGESIYTSGSDNASHSVPFTPPSTGITFNKKIRLRVIGDFNAITGPCSALSNGQAEDYSVVITQAPLPIELVNFSASAKSQSIALNWTTLSESNNKGFELERSIDPVNGFTKVAWIEGQLTSLESLTYDFEDSRVEANKQYYYRLQQIDLSGARTMSNEVSAKIDGTELGIKFVPNPASNHTQILLNRPTTSSTIVEIFAADGKNWMNKLIQEGQRAIELDLSNLPKGLYFIRLTNNGVISIDRLVVEK